MILSCRFFDFQSTSSISDELAEPDASCESVVRHSLIYLEEFTRFLGLTSKAHSRTAIDFEVSVLPSDYRGLQFVVTNSNGDTLFEMCKNLSERLNHMIQKYSSSPYFPLHRLAQFLQTANHQKEPCKLAIHYKCHEINRIVLKGKRTEILYDRGFLDALAKQSNWLLVTRTMQQESQILQCLADASQHAHCNSRLRAVNPHQKEVLEKLQSNAGFLELKQTGCIPTAYDSYLKSYKGNLQLTLDAMHQPVSIEDGQQVCYKCRSTFPIINTHNQRS